MNRRTRRRVYAVGVAAAVGLGAPWWGPPALSRVDAFEVREVGVTGTRYVPEDEVVARAAIPDSASVWDDPGGWETGVASHPLVEEADVVRVGMSRLEIRVREVEPVALVPTPELVPVDRGGRLLPLDPAVAGLDLPILGVAATRESGRLGEGDARALLDLLVRLEEAEPGFVARTSEIRPLAGAGAEVFLTEGPAGCERVLLPLDRPVRALERVGMVLGTRDSAVAAVDARFAGQVVVTRRGAS